MKQDCRVCGGQRVIRLPCLGRASDLGPFTAEDVAQEARAVRTYPCPACAPVVDFSRVAVVDVHAIGRLPASAPEDHQAYERGVLVRRLADELAAGGMVRFERDEGEVRPGGLFIERGLHATLSVVAPAGATTMQERFAEHESSLIRAIVERATKRINEWGSHRIYTEIEKDQAITELKRAADEVLAERRARQVF